MPREMPLGDPTNPETEWVRVPAEHRCVYCEELFPTAAICWKRKDAAQIARCLNSWPDLLEALKEAFEAAAKAEESVSVASVFPGAADRLDDLAAAKAEGETDAS